MPQNGQIFFRALGGILFEFSGILTTLEYPLETWQRHFLKYLTSTGIFHSVSCFSRARTKNRRPPESVQIQNHKSNPRALTVRNGASARASTQAMRWATHVPNVRSSMRCDALREGRTDR